jgi:hypothetical protein
MFHCRLTNSLKEHKPHFVRVAAYIVADLLQCFETHTLYPEVKVSIISYFVGSKMSQDEIQNSLHIAVYQYGSFVIVSEINFTVLPKYKTLCCFLI